MTWLNLAIVALAASRLTRLIVSDTITEPLRLWIWERWPGDNTTYGDSEVTDRKAYGRDVYLHQGLWYPLHPTFFGRLIECAWCAGIWVTSLVFVVAWFYPDIMPVLAVFAAAEIVGKLND